MTEAVLVRCLAARPRAMAGRTLILAYHNLVPDDAAPAGDQSLHLPRSSFAAQLDLIVRHCDVVALDDVYDRVQESRRPRVAITFDDAYASALALGIAELVGRGLPATIFVAPGLLGADTFWWDEVASARGPAQFEASRHRLLDDLAGEGARIRVQEGSKPHVATLRGEDLRAATEAELVQAAAQPGITIGSHTWSHPNLSRLPLQRVEEELTSSYHWLKRHCASFVPWLAYPYGLHSAEVAQLAERAGYRGALRVSGGWLAPAPEHMHELPRFNVPRGLSLNGLRLRLAGLFAETAA